MRAAAGADGRVDDEHQWSSRERRTIRTQSGWLEPSENVRRAAGISTSPRAWIQRRQR
jgi:hypothetical protein